MIKKQNLINGKTPEWWDAFEKGKQHKEPSHGTIEAITRIENLIVEHSKKDEDIQSKLATKEDLAERPTKEELKQIIVEVLTEFFYAKGSSTFSFILNLAKLIGAMGAIIFALKWFIAWITIK